MKFANGLKIGAEILLAATFVILLIVSINDILAGNFAGTSLLVPAAVFAIFMWLGWIKPSETGLALVLLGAIVIIVFRNTTNSPIAWRTMGSSTLVTGLLLLGAGWKFHQNHDQQAPSS